MSTNIGIFTDTVNGYLTGRARAPQRSSYRSMLEEVLTRIEARLKALGLSAAAASRSAGLSEDAIRNMKRAIKDPQGRKGVSTRTVAALAPVLKTSVAWLMEGVGNEEASETSLPPPNTDLSKAEDVPNFRPFGGVRDVPEYGAAAGGKRGDADFRFNGQTVDMAPRPPGIANKKDVYALRVTGESMSPKYEEGERIYVDPHRSPAIMDYVVVELHSSEEGEPGDGFIKRLVRRTPTKFVVSQFNPPKELEFDRDEVKSLHRVIPTDELLGI